MLLLSAENAKKDKNTVWSHQNLSFICSCYQYASDSRLQLLSVRSVVTCSAVEHQCLLASTKSYCLVTHTHTHVNNLPVYITVKSATLSIRHEHVEWSVIRYNCMLHCWDAEQESRPDFTELVTKLGDFLETGVRQVTMAVSTDIIIIIITVSITM